MIEERDARPAAPAENAAMVALGAELERVLGELTEVMHQEMTERIPDLRGDNVLLELLRVSIHSNLSALVQVFSYRLEPDQVPTPLGAREYARRLAQHGISVTALVRAYRLGQQRLLTWALEQWEQQGPGEEPQGVALTTVAELIRTASGYIDSISEQVIAEYGAEREQWLAHRDRARAEVLTRLLAGEHVDLAVAERTLAYRLQQRHLGVVLWVDGQSPERPTGVFQAAAGRLARAVGGAAPLLWTQDSTSAWVWVPLGARDVEVADAVPHGLLAEEQGPTVRAALGRVASGSEGFRVTAREAQQARQVATVPHGPERPLTSYDDAGVRAASLLVADLADARRMVADALGELARDTASAQRLRETLSVVLAERGSLTRAAERLHVHKNTVKYRVRQAAELRGRPLEEDRWDLELALHGAHHLGAAVLAP